MLTDANKAPFNRNYRPIATLPLRLFDNIC